MFADGVKFVEGASVVPVPFANVFQPPNRYPFLATFPCADIGIDPATVVWVCVAGAVPVPPLVL